ncbi:MAG: MotA/TolQ/ExbB proton channel family protein [Pseudomonas sp.]
MDVYNRSLPARGWQGKLRWLSLACLVTLSTVSAGFVLAQAGVDPAQAAAASPADPASTALSAGVAGERFGVREMFTQADLVVKSVMVLLVLMSLMSWAILFEKLVTFGAARRQNTRFLRAFRAGDNTELEQQTKDSALGRMWLAAQAELRHFRQHRDKNASADQINRLLQRMALTASIVQERDLARLGGMMGVLATIGATAPFIGLFGTVWGILNSFAGIATAKSASLAVVAPGIAEALLATALGLFAAIPAVMIFNKFARDINGFVGSLDNFSAELLASVSRQFDEVH